MSTNKIIRGLCSLPIIFIILYFIPVLGICLVVLRQLIYKDKKKYTTSISIIVFGILMFIPKVVDSILDLINNNTLTIPYINNIVKSTTYTEVMEYGKFLRILGVILLIISSIFKTISEKISSLIHSSISNRMQIEKEIDKENNLQIKMKQERAKNTNYVKCPNCGSDNILSEKTGTCMYCRRIIKNDNYNKEG